MFGEHVHILSLQGENGNLGRLLQAPGTHYGQLSALGFRLLCRFTCHYAAITKCRVSMNLVPAERKDKLATTVDPDGLDKTHSASTFLPSLYIYSRSPALT